MCVLLQWRCKKRNKQPFAGVNVDSWTQHSCVKLALGGASCELHTLVLCPGIIRLLLQPVVYSVSTSFNIYVPQIIFVTVQLQCFWNLFNTIKIGYKKSNPVNSNTCTHLKENLAVFFRSWRSHPHATTWGVVSKPLVITGLNCPVIFREKQSLMHHRMMMPAAANTFCLYTPKFNSPESLSSLSAQTSPWCVVPAP